MKHGNNRKVNHSLTRMIIDLHEKGYSSDFFKVEETLYAGMIPDYGFLLSTVHIQVLSLFYDPSVRKWKYVHTVETHTGVKGVLITEVA